MTRFFTSVLLVGFGFNAFTQLNNMAFEDRLQMDSLRSGKLYFGINGMGYLNNNEYSDDLVDGFTLFGYQATPYLSYYLGPHIRIDAGLFMQKEFGRQNFTHIDPYFTFKIKQNNWSILFGNIEGSLNHRYIEPIYNFERVMTSRLEHGLQGIWQTDRVFLDVWINWEQMIFRGDPFQEEFSAGLSFDYKILVNDQVEVNIPVQIFAYHRGGEIDSSPGPVSTLLNGALGGGITYRQGNGGLIEKIKMLNYFVFYQDQSNQKLLPFEDGFGIYLNADFQTKYNLDIMLSYWRGEEYIAQKGGDLYQSAFFGQVEQVRQMFFIRMLHHWDISDQVTLSTRFQPVINLENGDFNFTQGIYLNFRPDFFLLRPKE